MNKMIEFCSTHPILPYITNGVNVCWSQADALSMELMYEARSGEKWLSPILQKIFDDATQDAKQIQLQSSIGIMYGDKWSRLYKALITDYAPLNNYDMTERETIERDGTDEATNTGSGSTSGETTKTYNSVKDVMAHVKDATKIMTVTDTDTNRTQTAEHQVSAYNATGYQASEKDTTTFNGPHTQTTQGADDYTDTNTRSGNEKDVDSSTTATNSRTEGQHSEDVVRELTRAGNIGVTTSQQMLESEVVLRNKYKFWDIVFADLDSLLTLPIY